MSYFAEIDENNIVKRVITAEQDFIDSGIVGDSSLWIETKRDGSIRKQYAGIGYTYDKVNDIFISRQTYPSWVLDSNFDWQPPTTMPSDDTLYSWNEETISWKEDKEPI
jgi:hypothetical protein